MKWHRILGAMLLAVFSLLSANVATAAAAVPTPDELFVWAEQLLPTTFPKGPVTGVGGVYQGITYTYRCYPTNSCIGVVTAGGPIGRVDALIGGVVKSYGSIADYADRVNAGPAKAGTVDFSAAGQYIRPDFVDGQIPYLGSADGQGYSLAPAKVAKVCFVSDRRGWGVDAQACAVPQANGELKLAGLCSNDKGLVTVWRNDVANPADPASAELWVDFKSIKGWKLAGDLAPSLVGEFIQYGNYKPAKVVYDKATAKLTLRFGSDCLGGFVYEQTPKNWKSAPLVAGDLKFVWDGAGKQAAYLDFDPVAKEYLVTFTGLACGQRANVKVYKAKSGTGATVAWEDNLYAWLGIPDANAANPIWMKEGVDFFVQSLLNGEERSVDLKC